MKLKVLRFSSQKDSTNGLLFDDSDGQMKFLCYTLEDEYREEKIQGETRIPAGTYKIELRTEGGIHARYTKKYGCLLVGDSQENNAIIKDGFIGKSTSAYKRIYPDIAKAVQTEGVTIEYINLYEEKFCECA